MAGQFLFDDEFSWSGDRLFSTRLGRIEVPPEQIVEEPATIGASYVDVTDAVQRIYDALRQSMDYGSGMLDTEDMQALLLLGTLMGASDLRDLRADIRQASMGLVDPHPFDSDRPDGAARCLRCGGHEYMTAHDQDNPECPICGSTKHTSTEQHQRLVTWAVGLRTHGHADTADAAIAQLIIDPVFVAWEKTEHDAEVTRIERERFDRRVATGELSPEDF